LKVFIFNYATSQLTIEHRLLLPQGRSFLFTTKRNEPKKRSPKSQNFKHFLANAKLAMLKQRVHYSETIQTFNAMKGFIPNNQVPTRVGTYLLLKPHRWIYLFTRLSIVAVWVWGWRFSGESHNGCKTKGFEGTVRWDFRVAFFWLLFCCYWQKS